MPQFASILASVTYDTPRIHAATIMMHEAMPPMASPTPGMKPTMPSRPKRIAVPGERNQSGREVRRWVKVSVVDALAPGARGGGQYRGQVDPLRSGWHRRLHS